MPSAAYARVSPSIVRAALAISLLTGCPAHIAHNRQIVREVTIHGSTQINENELRERIATRETPLFPGNSPRWLRWWRWWWTEPEYLDENGVTRDRRRILRYLQARGFYDAAVPDARITSLGEPYERVEFTLQEGTPTRVSDVRLRGCEAGTLTVLPTAVCDTIRGRFTLHPGSLFDEDAFTHDRQQVEDFTREAGFPTPRVVPRAVVDPTQHAAWLEYTIVPGPVGRFGNIRLLALPNLTPVTGAALPNGVPTDVIRSALGIEPGERYSRSILSTAQQSLFDLGVFGIARIEESPQPDGVVDLNVQLSSTRLWRLRLGGGFQGDNINLNAHLLAGYEHRNFLGGLRRLRLEARPELYLPITALVGSAQDGVTSLRPGVSTLAEIHQPEIFRHTAAVLSTGFDYGPDPYNPSVAFREMARAGIGLEHRFSTHVTASAYLRFNQMSYTSTSSGTFNDPLYRQQYINQSYGFASVSLTWDLRNSTVRPTHGTLIALTADGSVAGPLSDYTFVRGRADLRGFVPLGGSFVLAARGLAGLAVGDTASSPSGWPVPQELRFYSGGAQSNRGYSFNRVGALSTVPVANSPGTDDPTRYIALGGTAVWEFSTEVRWQPGALGVVAFFDASNVVGIDPQPYVSPSGSHPGGCTDATAGNPVTSAELCPYGGSAPAPLPPGDAIATLFRDAHPATGLGVRYLTPIGPIRLDVGIRLTDWGCSAANGQIAAQNAAVVSGHPSYYVASAPRCDFFGSSTIPAVFHFAIGEAY